VRILCRRRGRPSRIGKLTAKLTTGGDDVSKLLPVLSADYELGLLAASDLQRPAGRLGRGGPSGRFRRSESATISSPSHYSQHMHGYPEH